MLPIDYGFFTFFAPGTFLLEVNKNKMNFFSIPLLKDPLNSIHRTIEVISSLFQSALPQSYPISSLVTPCDLRAWNTVDSWFVPLGMK